MRDFTSVVISGGAFWTIAAVGAIKRLSELQSLSVIKNFVGTSAGALICTALALEISPEDILSFILDITKDDDICRLDIAEILNILDTYGMISGKNIDNLVEALFRRYNIPLETNFLEFAKLTGKNLVICVSNLSEAKSEFWCVDETPLVPIRIALKASCSVPFIVSPVTYESKLYVDGCVYNNFPINYFNNHSLQDIFSIRVIDFDHRQPINNMLAYVHKMIVSMIYNMTEMNIANSSHKENIVHLTIKADDLVKFSDTDMKFIVPPENIVKMYIEGYKKASQSINLRNSILSKQE